MEFFTISDFLYESFKGWANVKIKRTAPSERSCPLARNLIFGKRGALTAPEIHLAKSPNSAIIITFWWEDARILFD